MIPTDTVFNYTEEENIQIRKQVEDFLEIFNEVSNKILFLKKQEKKPEINSETGLPIPQIKEVTDPVNVFFINPSIKKQFLQLQNEKMSTREILNKYEEWFDEMWRLFIVNEQATVKKREKLLDHLIEIYQICGTFPELLKVVTTPPKK